MREAVPGDGHEAGLMMDERVTIQNDELSVTVSLMGAQIRSMMDGSREYIWQADPTVWANSAPVLFPICGRLNGNYYLYKGKRYDMEIHGFARSRRFQVESLDSDRMTLLLVSDQRTKAQYPFAFEFRVRFVLERKSLHVTYETVNTGEENMYFSFGGHEGYACPEGVEAYELVFPEDETITRHLLRNGFLYGDTEEIHLEDHRLALDYREFERCTYVFRGLNSRRVILAPRGNDGHDKVRPSLCVEFAGFPVLALWTLQDRKYLCIEPWCGSSENEHTESRLEEKPGILMLEAGERLERTHTISVIGKAGSVYEG